MGYLNLEVRTKNHPAALALLIVASLSLVASYDITSECAKACATCVSFYGRELYDGRLCIMNCRATAGNSLDDMCQNESYHLVKKSEKTLMVRSCRKYCGLCVLRWSKTVYHGTKCIQMCDASQGVSVDPDCANPIFNRLDKSIAFNQIWTEHTLAIVLCYLYISVFSSKQSCCTNLLFELLSLSLYQQNKLSRWICLLLYVLHIMRD